MSPLLILFTLITLSLPFIHAHIDGAGACFDNPNDMIDFLQNHQQPMCPPEGSQFGIYTTPMSVDNTLIAGCKYTISLCGPKPFEGFLLYAQSPMMSPSRIGKWSSPISTPSQLMTCSGSSTGTITHINPAKKMHADFSFITPNYVNGTSRNATVTINARVVVQLTEWYTTSLTLNYLNIDNQKGSLCPDPSSLMLTACPSKGILDTSGCPAAGATPDPMAGMDMGDNSGSVSSGTTTAPSSMGNMNMNMGNDMNSGMTMSTVFSTNWSGIQLVFPGFTLNNTGIYIGALVCSFAVAFGLELIQWVQYQYDQKLLKQQQESISKSESKLELEEEFRNTNLFSSCQQFSRSLLHTLRVFLSLFLMMIWMTLNVGLVLAALGGSFIGYYFLQQIPKPQTSQAGCHI